MIKFVYEQKEKDSTGVVKSNRGGWQSDSFYYSDDNLLMSTITKSLTSYFNENILQKNKKFDIDALNEMMQSYATSDLQKFIENLPREQGVGIVLDDTNEKIYALRIRPRFSLHGGDDPNAIRGKILSNFSSTISSDDKNLK